VRVSEFIDMNKGVGFDVFTAVVMKSSVFWDKTPCSWFTFNGLHGFISLKIEVFMNKYVHVQ
jgi:hypothetical protein